MSSQLAASAMSDAPDSQRTSVLGWVALVLGGAAMAYLIYYNVSHGEHHGAADHHAPPLWGLGILPFVGILGSIAILPLLPATHHWWERNVNRFAIALACGGLTILYYLFARGADSILPVLNHAIPVEYVPFIVLLFSLYVISGGICLKGDLAAHPATNTGFLAFGAAIASFIGTTGASMLLIRPLLQTNSERRHVVHTVVFFIFLVSNIGGTLLPIGDPPLFLGYLRGVEFFWTLGLWKQWAFCCVILLIIYYVWDSWAYRREAKADIRADEAHREPLSLTGVINILWLAGVVAAVAFIVPGKPFPVLGFEVFPFLRELVMLALVGLSLLTTPRGVREDNQFNYAAILEVAALFVGIFIAMQVPIEVLKASGDSLKAVMTEPWQFFWSTGALSSFLDNAPTYVVFFELGKVMPPGSAPVALGTAGELGQIAGQLLVAISLGAVFMGAMTYIGNGPNFMVKAIAEQSGIRMPSFFGYMFRYSLPILVPVFVIVTVIFLGGNGPVADEAADEAAALVEPAPAAPGH
ncbi:MAG: sodium:proton antiporter [Planctomycetota bacterium]|jgi:Na+/H+ antiporter NhaD/arsenite permease-like protein